MSKKYYYSWKECLIDIQKIARQVSLSDFKPDVIVGVSRGGLVPAVALSHWFKLPMVPIRTSLRDFPAWETYTPEKKHKNVLIVDDVCDGGETFHKINDEIKEFCDLAKFASLSWNNECNFTPHVFAREVAKDSGNLWIHFPWEFENTQEYITD
jgi:hypoxanthine phosphoribosyltransferase